MTASMRSAWCGVGAARFHYRVAEPATTLERPLVLVHGLGVSSAYFARLQPRLARSRAVFAPDLPGCGQTASPAPAHSVPELAAALEEWLVARGLGEVDLFGHSLGGQVVAELAGRRPDRVTTLILAAPTLGQRGKGPLVLWSNLLRDGVREPLSLYRAVLPAYLRCGARRMLHIDALADRNDLAGALQTLTQPLLVLRGARDHLFSAADLTTLRDAVPGLTAIVVPGAAHALHWSHPEVVASLVESFLASSADKQ